MKLSEITTDKALDVLCEITEPICNITTDKKLLDALKVKTHFEEKPTSAQLLTIGVNQLISLVPILFKEHKLDCLQILASINGRTLEEQKTRSFKSTIMDLKELLNDEDFHVFFKSCVDMVGSE